jgi:hypothetical protein
MVIKNYAYKKQDDPAMRSLNPHFYYSSDLGTHLTGPINDSKAVLIQEESSSQKSFHVEQNTLGTEMVR